MEYDGLETGDDRGAIVDLYWIGVPFAETSQCDGRGGLTLENGIGSETQVSIDQTCGMALLRKVGTGFFGGDRIRDTRSRTECRHVDFRVFESTNTIIRIVNRRLTHPREEHVQCEARYLSTICLVDVETLTVGDLGEECVVGQVVIICGNETEN